MKNARLTIWLVIVTVAIMLTDVGFGQVNAELIRVRGGALPVGASSPFHLAGAGEYDVAPLVDGNHQTGIRVAGAEGTFDTGGYILLEFQTDRYVNEFHLDIYLRSFSGERQSWYLGCSADLTFSPFWSLRPNSDAIQVLSGSFFEYGNDFRKHGPSDYHQTSKQWQTIDHIRLADNRFQFLLWSPYMESIPDQGEQGIEIVEAYLTYIPEPATILLLGLGGLAVFKRKSVL